jgi:hypothetical protein
MRLVVQRHIGHRRARYVRISVRAFIVVVLAMGAGLGWIVRRSHVQRDAVVAITKAGGLVEYEWEIHSTNIKPKPWWPKCLMEWVGVDHFGNVVYVDFRRGVRDEDLIHVSRLDRLQHVEVCGQGVTDAGLVNLHALPQLELLSL